MYSLCIFRDLKHNLEAVISFTLLTWSYLVSLSVLHHIPPNVSLLLALPSLLSTNRSPPFPRQRPIPHFTRCSLFLSLFHPCSSAPSYPTPLRCPPPLRQRPLPSNSVSSPPPLLQSLLPLSLVFLYSFSLPAWQAATSFLLVWDERQSGIKYLNSNSKVNVQERKNTLKEKKKKKQWWNTRRGKKIKKLSVALFR